MPSERGIVSLDSKDVRILSLLSRRGRATLSEIGSSCDLADSTVQYRLTRLMKLGVIDRFAVLIDLRRLGYALEVTIGMSVQPRYIERVAEQLSRVPKFYSVWIVSGAHNISCRAAFKDQSDLSEALSFLHNLSGVKEYHLSILSERKKELVQIDQLA